MAHEECALGTPGELEAGDLAPEKFAGALGEELTRSPDRGTASVLLHDEDLPHAERSVEGELLVRGIADLITSTTRSDPPTRVWVDLAASSLPLVRLLPLSAIDDLLGVLGL